MQVDLVMEAINILQDTRKYINTLENKVSELENSKAVTSLLSYIQFHIYSPVKVFSDIKKCGKCDPNGMIRVDDSFYTRYRMCECQNKTFKYVTRKLGVFSTSYIESENHKVYDCLDDNNNLISIDVDCVKKSFSDKDCESDSMLLFYTNEDDCNKFCSLMNGSSDLSGGK